MTRIQVRRDTSANWTKNNPVLASGEPAYETDTGKFKIGDGSKNYTALPYQGDGSTPANMVTTDTTQTITGFKTFTNNLHVNAPIASNGISITCANNSQFIQGLTIINEDMSGRQFNISVNDAGQANISGTTLNIGDVSLNTYVSGRNINMTTGDTGNLVVNTNNPIKVHNKTANTDDIVLVQGNIKAGDNVSLTKDTTTGDITISSTGGGGSTPANMVTTDTDQDITGVKRFLNNRQDLSKPAIKIGSYAAGQDNYDGGYITVGNGNLEIGDYYATNSKGGFLSINSTADSSIFKITSNNSNINPRLQLGLTNYEGEIYNDVAEGLCLSNRKYDYSGQRSILKIKGNTLTFTKTDGTVVDLLAGGGSTPANMVTTDTDQFITGTKSFYSSINFKSSETDNSYSMITNTGGSLKLQAQYGNPAGLNVGVSSLTYTDASGIDHNLLSSGATINDSAASDTSTYSSSKIEKLTNITSSDTSITVTKSDTGVDIVANKSEWVYKTQVLINNVAAVADDVTIDLSEYLPNDGYDYEIMFNGTAQPIASTVSKFMHVKLQTNKLEQPVSVVQSRTAVANVDASAIGNCILPIDSTSRSVIVIGSTSQNFGGTRRIVALAYRRIN